MEPNLLEKFHQLVDGKPLFLCFGKSYWRSEAHVRATYESHDVRERPDGRRDIYIIYAYL